MLNSEYGIRMTVLIMVRSGNPCAAQPFVALITKGEVGKFPKHLKSQRRELFEIAQAITKANSADSWVTG